MKVLTEEISRQKKLMGLAEQVMREEFPPQAGVNELEAPVSNSKTGIPLEKLPPEDQNVFKQIFNNAEVKGASGPDYEGNYISVHSFRSWDGDGEGVAYKGVLRQKVGIFNSKSANYEMKITGYSDFETEYDHDRNWPAMFTFAFYPKASAGGNVEGQVAENAIEPSNMAQISPMTKEINDWVGYVEDGLAFLNERFPDVIPQAKRPVDRATIETVLFGIANMDRETDFPRFVARLADYIYELTNNDKQIPNGNRGLPSGAPTLPSAPKQIQ